MTSKFYFLLNISKIDIHGILLTWLYFPGAQLFICADLLSFLIVVINRLPRQEHKRDNE